jgi:hypothetical protein
MNMGMLLEPLLALSVVFLPILGCYALIEVQMSRKVIRQPETAESSDASKADHGRRVKTVDCPESGRTRQHVHLCPICGKRHLVNEARHRVSYGKQYSCSSECEAKRRKEWRHSAYTCLSQPLKSRE